ncbi:MAG TPA: MBOAT family O-acyltransferase [Gammaproteobacteria bacterium]|nr:MBOAT family O-acyltransferase [Gammaproteobacteria bacterium]
MVFASHSFLAFLLILLLAYWLAGRHDERWGKAILITASFVFYGFWIPAYLLLLIASILFNHVIARAVLAGPERHLRLALTSLGIVLNLALIGFYKYAAFLVESLNWTLQTGFDIPDIILPIGISFFTFQQISLLVDAHKGWVRQLRFWDHVLFIAFFPQLIAGPIVRQHDMLPQLAARRDWRLRADYVAIGIALFAFGLFKKTAIIDPFVPYLDLVYNAAADGDAVGFVDGWVAGIGYGFQVYFDFSAYSDMAIGLGFMFGLRLPVNFFSPYKAHNIRDFWRRWHISLSRFLRDYLFIPLGGSHHGLMRTVAALMVTMALGGLWHGAGWTFVIWGMLHGSYLAVNHLWHALIKRLRPPPVESKTDPRWPGWILHALSVVVTFLAVSFAWVFFRAPDLDAALRLAGAMLGFSGWHEIAHLTRGIVPMFPIYLFIVWLMPNTMELFQATKAALHVEEYRDDEASPLRPAWLRFKLSTGWAFTTAGVFVVAWFALSNLSPFIYFQF